MEDEKQYTLKELEQNINLEEFTKDWCSDDGLSLNQLCIKYNGSKSNIQRYVGNHKLVRSKIYKNNKRKQTNLEKYGVEHASQNKEIKEKVKQTNLEKYGVENPLQSEEIWDKIKQTNLEKYGVENPSQSKEIRNKIKQTNLKKYGVEAPSQSEEIKNKMKQTNLEKYGAENPFANKEVQEKIKQTNLEKYGVEHALQNKEIKEKAKQTNFERYGVTNPFASKEIQEKAKQTILEKYGVKHALQNKKIKEKVKQTNLEKYGAEYPSQNSDIKEKAKRTNLEKYGAEYPSQNSDIKEKVKQTNLEKYGVLYTCQADFCKNASNGMHSKPNEDFAKILDENHIEYVREFPLENMSYDFKVGNILIEINPSGTHNSTWGTHNKSGISKNYHKEKSKLATQNKYQCIHVFDWDNQSKILDLLKQRIYIYARQCEIKELQDTSIYQEFININHLQGYCKGNKIIIGLYYNDKLVETMSFGKPRYNKKFQYELLRLCSDNNYNIVGGAEKLFKYFINKYNPDSIISYCDNSKFSGKVYYKLGFDEKNHAEPSKHWYNIKTKQHVTDNLLRQRGFDQLFDTDYGKGTSNEQLMIEHGFVEIYDCGQSVFIWKKRKD